MPGCGDQAGVQDGGIGAAAVADAGQPFAQPGGGEPVCAVLGVETGQERQADRRVDLGEQPDRAGEGVVEVGAQLVGDRDPVADEVLVGAAGAARADSGRAARGQRCQPGPVGAQPARLTTSSASGAWLVPAEFRSIGVHLVEGLINGVKSMTGDLVGTIGNMAQDALDAAEHFLGIGSPLKYTYEHGLWLMEGHSEGIKAGAPGMQASLRSALGGIPGLFPGSGGAGGSRRLNVTVPDADDPGRRGEQPPERPEVPAVPPARDAGGRAPPWHAEPDERPVRIVPGIRA